jgi:glutamate racemase
VIKQSQDNTAARNLPIGVFDSGLGGLTVVDQLQRQLANESIVYFGDTARVPYGTKSADTIRKFAVQIVEFLQKQGVKMIVVACNTVSSVALEQVVAASRVPVVNVIEPGARAALQRSQTKRIGVIGTTATVSAAKYDAILIAADPRVVVYSQACPLFVPLVEEGWIDTDVTERITDIYLRPLIDKQIDCLILGCTHYPIIQGVIRKIVNGRVHIIDSAVETAAEVQAVLSKQDLHTDSNNPPEHRFFVSDFPQRFEEIARRLLGHPLKNVRRIALADDRA